ncbi:IclR family transcriptional regulator [Allopusillimonas soli]|uniref:IclR family transcriptional regulator n=1 Tax=Allopusillimonas soli TaxID=659016 RepID=UPI001431DFCA|nr:IclR family transcriptional regulator [Allopusillimonas soli]
MDRAVAAAERTLSILEAFMKKGGIVSLPELERETGLFKSVICRYLLSFERHGYAFKRSDGKYQLGVSALRLGKTYEKAFDAAHHITPLLQRLATATQESASYYVRQNDLRLCLYRVESPRSLRVSVQPGSLWPIDETATGRIFQRFSSERPEHDILPEQGFLAHSSNIGQEETSSLSAPVFGVDNLLMGALTISGPTSRFDPLANSEARQLLVAAAKELSREFGAAEAV